MNSSLHMKLDSDKKAHEVICWGTSNQLLYAFDSSSRVLPLQEEV
jgi:hypothetical protein